MRIKSVGGRLIGVLVHETQAAIELGYSSRCVTCRSTHHRHEKTPARTRLKVVGDRGERWIAGGNESRRTRILYVEEKDLLLCFQDAQQTTASDDLTVVGEADMMLFIAGRVRWRERRP